MTTVLVGALIGLGAGVLSGLFGIGGGLIIVPALVFLGVSQRTATGTSLAALLMPVGILGVITYSHRHEIRPLYAIGIAIGLTVGVLFGARWAGQISNLTLRRSFGGLLLIISAKFLLTRTG